jgi:UDP-MurNAc hydroxylase
MKITFFNHASVLFDCNGTRILTDPWYNGPAFDDGWSLINNDVKDINSIDFDYIWYSHEHPDHFSISDLKSITNKQSKTILIQEMEDKKVVNFCEKLGFTVQELSPSQEYKIGNATIRCQAVGGFDSWLSVRDEETGYTALNINDCRVETQEHVDSILRLIGPVDILLTQFGSANWTGNSGDLVAKQKSVAKVFKRLTAQMEGFKPTWCIPFASFIRFSHEENQFCNEHTVSLRDFYEKYKSESDIVIMRPHDVWSPAFSVSSQKNLRAWEEESDQPATYTTQTKTLEELQSAFSGMRVSLEKNNDWHAVQSLNFSSVNVYLTDHDKCFVFDIRNTSLLPGTQDYDIKLSSDSLYNIMKNAWGRGTLFVNGRFSTGNNFKAFVQQTQIYYGNNIGLTFPETISESDVMNPGSFVFELLETI